MNKIELCTNKPGQRFVDAVSIQGGACNPIAISRALVRAIEEVRADVRTPGTDAICNDPAVRAIAHQLAFLCNTTRLDVSGEDYDTTMEACRDGELVYNTARDAERIFQYFINLDERGEFYADVRKLDGTTVYEIRCPGVDEEDTTIFDDGFMNDKHDIDGLKAYLQDIKILPATAILTEGN